MSLFITTLSHDMFIRFYFYIYTFEFYYVCMYYVCTFMAVGNSSLSHMLCQ